MSILFRRVAAFVALVFLVACGGGSGVIPFDHESASSIHSIGVLSTQWPRSPVATVPGDPATMIPVIGGLAVAVAEKARNVQLQDIVQSRGYSGPAHFVDYLRAAVAAEGYHVIHADMERGGFDYLSDYGTTSGADAWLDCVGLEWGYLAASSGNDTPYRPEALVKCRLVSAKDRKILMRDLFVYTYSSIGSRGFVTVAPDPAYVFPNFDTLKADPDRAVAGIDAALKGVAQAVAAQIK